MENKTDIKKRIALIRGGKEHAQGLKSRKRTQENTEDDEWKGKKNYLGPGQQNYPFFPF